ncbi:YDG domain-containing protein [Glaciimonas sp. GG7]
MTIKSSAGTVSGSTGTVNVNDVVSWSANKLTLNAQNNLNINAVLNGSGSASLTVQFGQGALALNNTSVYTRNAVINLPAGNNYSVLIGSDGVVRNFTVINSLGAAGSITGTDLQGVEGALSTNYVLGGNIDASTTSGWNTGTGFMPIGTAVTPYTGVFDGLGHAISNLTINRPSAYSVGLFGSTSSTAVIRSVGLIGGSVSGFEYVGALIGHNDGTVRNNYSTVNVVGALRVGGLIGDNDGGIIYNNTAIGMVSGAYSVGGLVGYNYYGSIGSSRALGNVIGNSDDVGGLIGTNNFGVISNSYAIGSVSGTSSYVGGLIGVSNLGTVTNSYATGSVNGTYNYVGGLIGNNSSVINTSYASGSVSGGSEIGGLIGANSNNVNNSYATGSVHGNYAYDGGLIGYNGGSVNGTYATGKVSGNGSVGGLIGSSSNSVSNSFWDITTTGQTASSGGIGMLSAQMKQQANFTSATTANGNLNPGGDFTNTWAIYNGYTYPLLRAFMTAITVTANNATKTYDGQAYAGASGVTYSSTPNSNLAGTVSYSDLSGNAAVHAGSYSIIASGLYSNQQGYLINYNSGALTVNQAQLNLTGVTASSKMYDATTVAKLVGTAAVAALGHDVVTITGTGVGAFALKDVGLRAVTVSGYALAGANAADYTLVEPTSLLAAITPAQLNVTGLTASGKVYDGTTVAKLAGTATVAALAHDVVTVTGTGVGTFALKDVGLRAVTVSGYALAGANAADYTLVEPTSLLAAITPAQLNVTGLTASGKVYDGTTVAKLAGTATVAALAHDVVTVTGTGVGTFALKDVGLRAVTVSGYALAGANAADYTLVEPTSLLAAITPAQLNVTGLTASGKVYDGTTVAKLAGTATVAALAHDVVTVTGTGVGTFALKDVGSRAVTVSGYVLGGASAADYTLVEPTSLSATITAAQLNVTGLTASSKVYDGTTVAKLVGKATVAALGHDVVSLSGTGVGTFALKDVGVRAVSVGGYTLAGANAGDYTLVEPTGLSASITSAH